ncbi:MAG: mitofilin family membrane protein [Alphaproteobacteria bacterium]|nr:mitofilin family membrane protein [Alphaproteobacteria bacterium]
MVDDKQSSDEPDKNEPGSQTDTPAESPWEGSSDAAVDAGDDALEETADDASEPKKGGGGRGPLVVLGIVVLLAVGLYFAWPALQPRLLALLPQPAAEAMESVRALDKRVAQLEAANARLDAAVAAVKETLGGFAKQLGDLSQGVVDGDMLAALSEKLAAVEDTLSQLGQEAGEGGAAALAALSSEMEALKARLSEQADAGTAGQTNAPNEEFTALARQVTALGDENKALRQDVAALQARLQRLEQSVLQSEQRQSARLKTGVGEGLVLALGQLRQTVLSGTPYDADLAAVASLMGEDQALRKAVAALAPWAKQGVPTMRALSDGFPAMTRAVLQAEPGGTDSFWRRTLRRVTSLVTVRRVGEVEGAEADAVLARAERRLAAGELAASAALVEGLPEPGRAAARRWLDQAKARLGAMAALASLQSRAIAGLADG